MSEQTPRLPPHSLEAERSVLGGLLLVPEAWEKVVDKLSEEDFYRNDHRLIYRAIASLHAGDKPSDVITVADWLETHQLDADAGGVDYLTEIAATTPGAANIEAYAGIVREKSILRQLVDIGGTLTEQALSPPEGKTSDQILELAETKVFSIREQISRTRSGFADMRQLIGGVLDQIDLMSESDSLITGLETGFVDFDQAVLGLQKSDLIIIAGRPAMGKTSFAMNIAENIACSHMKKDGAEKRTVAVFSMEMSASQLAMRLVSSLSSIDNKRLKTGNLYDEDWTPLRSAADMLNQSNLFIDDTPALTPMDIRARCRRLARKMGGLDLIVVDYLQLMQGGGRTDNRTEEISQISRSLKALAKEMDVPVIALSQLNRSLEQRKDRRPMMADLRESGAIEQDADLILFVYRDAVYNPETPEPKKAEIIIGKNRHGPTDTINLTFNGQFYRFDNYKFDDEIVVNTEVYAE
jgi:replicative DNA helicase